MCVCVCVCVCVYICVFFISVHTTIECFNKIFKNFPLTLPQTPHSLLLEQPVITCGTHTTDLWAAALAGWDITQHLQKFIKFFPPCGQLL